MTPLRSTRRPALGCRIGAAGLAKARVTIAPGLVALDRAIPDDIDFITDRIMSLPEGTGGATAVRGRS